jgi:hypothetical protein
LGCSLPRSKARKEMKRSPTREDKCLVNSKDVCDKRYKMTLLIRWAPLLVAGTAIAELKEYTIASRKKSAYRETPLYGISVYKILFENNRAFL